MGRWQVASTRLLGHRGIHHLTEPTEGITNQPAPCSLRPFSSCGLKAKFLCHLWAPGVSLTLLPCCSPAEQPGHVAPCLTLDDNKMVPSQLQLPGESQSVPVSQPLATAPRSRFLLWPLPEGQSHRSLSLESQCLSGLLLPRLSSFGAQHVSGLCFGRRRLCLADSVKWQG